MKPRLELRRSEPAPPDSDKPSSNPWPPAGSTPLCELQLWLVNESAQPVDAHEPWQQHPEIFDAAGGAVGLFDHRVVEMPPRQPPRWPGQLVEAGESRHLQTLVFARMPDGQVAFVGAHGTSVIPAGRYRVRMTGGGWPLEREAWMSGLRQFGMDAEQMAAENADYFARVEQIWAGPFEPGELELQLG